MLKYIRFLLLTACTVLTANPVGDAYFTKKFLNRFPYQTEQQTQEFYMGAMFPGITLFDPNMEEKTRFENVTVFEILQEKSPFVAGMKFHNLLRDARSNLIDQYGDFDIEVERKSEFLQILENEALYHTDYYGDRAAYFTRILPIERILEGDRDVLELWHAYLISTLADSPRFWVARARYLKNSPYTCQELESWHKAFPIALENPKISEYVENYPVFIEKKLLEK